MLSIRLIHKSGITRRDDEFAFVMITIWVSIRSDVFVIIIITLMTFVTNDVRPRNHNRNPTGAVITKDNHYHGFITPKTKRQNVTKTCFRNPRVTCFVLCP